MINFLNVTLKEVVEILKKFFKRDCTIIKEGEIYSIKQVNDLYKNLKEDSQKVLGFNVYIKNNISRRRALIVFLQESFYKTKIYPDDIDIKYLEEKARKRFTIGNRAVGEFDRAQTIHPKKPREFYEDENGKMSRYREALSLLASVPDAFFEKEEAIESFLKIYEDLKEWW